MADLADASAVLARYFPRAEFVLRIEPLGNAGGWSGSRLWRVSTPGGDYCLRRWPRQHPSPQQLVLIHTVMARAARDLPAVPLPQTTTGGATFVEQGGHLWELVTWRPGKADYRDHPSRQRLRAALQTLALFHTLAGRDHNVEPSVPPALQERRERWAECSVSEVATIERSLQHALGNEIDSLAPRLLQLAPAAHDAPERNPGRWLCPKLPLQPAVRDIHHDHVLFTGDEVTGLIDFGAMRIDTPLADVARLVGSLAGDDRAARQFALDAYSELRPLSEMERQFVDLLDETGLILSAFNWLTWLYVERRDMGPAAPIARRLTEIAQRLALRAHF